MSGLFFSPLVERAMRIAAKAHRHHHRKGSDLPYITHPASAALLLLKAGIDDDEILAAALLHDVVEDTDHTLDMLTADFPAKVVQLVAAMTERKHDHDGRKRSWQERKDEHLRHIAAEPWEARAIVLADKLHNLGSMRVDLENGEEVWSRFNAPPGRVLWYHREMIAAASQNDPRLAGLAAECTALIEHLATRTPDNS
ncbi:MAG: bifunctional (p)ppGpp synthetase/guanosine-3',5'-bis(diphosphate) 3'-pyrophosphohydrolase [Planctomycetaceae bacterium]|nr:bifunctional (p)ppGpp synthetase/guanosine-3',5'-bis(diphosphate) 3'-pyrophosphohydrolase [Planctomycetaceae bacterium]